MSAKIGPVSPIISTLGTRWHYLTSSQLRLSAINHSHGFNYNIFCRNFISAKWSIPLASAWRRLSASQAQHGCPVSDILEQRYTILSSSNLTIAGNIAAISLIGTPALLRSQKEDNLPSGVLAKQWRNMFENGKSQNPPVAAGVTSAFLYLAWSARSGAPLFKKTPVGRTALFSAAAVLTVGIVPFTIVAMSSTNNKLLEKSESLKNSSDAETVDLVQHWTTLNQIRGSLPLIGGLCGIVASLL